MEKRKSFVFFTEWAEALSEQDDKVRLEVFDAIVKYASEGEEVKLSSSAAQMAFTFIKQQLERDCQKYEETRRRRSEAKKRDWAKKHGENTNDTIVTNDTVDVDVDVDVDELSKDNDIYNINKKTQKNAHARTRTCESVESVEADESKKKPRKADEKSQKRTKSTSERESERTNGQKESCEDALPDGKKPDSADEASREVSQGGRDPEKGGERTAKEDKLKSMTLEELEKAVSQSAEDRQKWLENFSAWWNDLRMQTGTRMSPLTVLMYAKRRDRIVDMAHKFGTHNFYKACINVQRSSYCNGNTAKRTRPVDFDWALLNEDNLVKAIEGNL